MLQRINQLSSNVIRICRNTGDSLKHRVSFASFSLLFKENDVGCRSEYRRILSTNCLPIHKLQSKHAGRVPDCFTDGLTFCEPTKSKQKMAFPTGDISVACLRLPLLPTLGSKNYTASTH